VVRACRWFGVDGESRVVESARTTLLSGSLRICGQCVLVGGRVTCCRQTDVLILDIEDVA